MKIANIVIAFVLLAGFAFAPSTAQAAALSYDSCFQVQNLDSANAANIVISYYAQGDPTSVDVPDSIPANSSTTYCPLDAIDPGFNGSVVISSDREIAAIANVTGASPSWSGFDASYAGFTEGATSVSVPLLMKDNYGFNTWFNVQNAGGTADAAVHIVYSDGLTADITVPVNQAKTVDQSTEAHSAGWYGAATLTSDQPIVVTVMEVGPTMLFGYNGFTTSVTDPWLPLINVNNYGYTTGVQIQNAGDVSTDVTVTFTPSLFGTACTETQTIAAHASATFALHAWDVGDAGNNTCLNGETFVGSGQVTGNTGNVGLVGIVNQHNFATQKGAAYGSFNAAAATDVVVLPLIMDRNYGYFTGFNVMNVGAADATVTCTFTGNAYTYTETIGPGEAFTQIQLNKLADKYVGAATCTAADTSSQIIAVVNELLNVGSSDTFLVYEAFSK